MASIFIQRLTVDATTWLPVVIPANCREWWLRNKIGSLLVRSDPADSLTQDDVGRMGQYIIRSQAQFFPGDTPCYVKLPDGTAGTQTVVFTAILLGRSA